MSAVRIHGASGSRPACALTGTRARLTRQIVAACLALLAGAAAADDGPASAATEALRLRLLQYEALRNAPSEERYDLALGLCIDDGLNGRWLLGSDSLRSDRAARAASRVQAALQECLLQREGGNVRGVAEIRAALRKELLRGELREKVASGRKCLSSSAGPDALHQCLSRAEGRVPSEADWKRWLTLHRHAHGAP